mmetsp:Transcript_25817/g.60785  ORF Transcript_25817/g.60785 Transcript_25817/m.60785 type:complete len:209 (+) Transcript_25817:152-778(+)|eukprot:CAMPEP_0172387842 /NCGR_PEP_ID=MMETSP1061-20121228/5063_1 /TAXON_ID=37318 /ORGANISM="Pseudo-nitzschia pungens, Strain cf. pungens" /LENGTH=208 /DNA_ID=CAMNT_0013117585 /DNA_START=118 /DNA_END=744 /DNA_ORIENTATION=-
MSSWDRARFIPWSKIPQDPSNLSDQKERIIRDIQREADRQEKAELLEQRRLKSSSTEGVASPSGEDAATSITQTKIPFKWGELFKSAAFGGCIGSITGSVFGFMDGMRMAGQNDVLKNSSNAAKGKFLMQGTTRSATIFGAFFGGFHCIKYGIRVALDPGDFQEVGLATAISMGGLMSKPNFRPAVPYATMLIMMDSFHLVMREYRKD